MDLLKNLNLAPEDSAWTRHTHAAGPSARDQASQDDHERDADALSLAAF
jgi:hypothetical protein